jgi:mannose-6-phosphate isomerase-like protein (cupin superfamily)
MRGPLNVTKTYWGEEHILMSQPAYCLKRLIMRAGTQSSLEFHCTKAESYLIESGTLIVGMRYDRAVDDSITLKAGDVYHIDAGIMHMRIAVTDVSILEVSTHDDPSDTHIVCDGKTYKHPYKESAL